LIPRTFIDTKRVIASGQGGRVIDGLKQEFGAEVRS